MRKQTRSRYRTARCVLHHEDQYLLAVHSSFWARRERRWGLPGGNIERGEHPEVAVRRELQEELSLDLGNILELGAYFYKGHDHMVYGADSGYRVEDYDSRELLDMRWFTLPEIQALDEKGRLHAGYELQAVRQFLALTY